MYHLFFPLPGFYPPLFFFSEDGVSFYEFLFGQENCHFPSVDSSFCIMAFIGK